jgi:hypothetical protein
MWKAMVLAAGLAGCIPLARAAEPAVPRDIKEGCFPFLPAYEEVTRVEIKGKLGWKETPAFWRVRVQVEYYYLDFGNNQTLLNLARKNLGNTVIVKGTLSRERLEGMEGEGRVNVLHVTSLEPDDSGYVKKTVSVTLRAKLHCVITDYWTGKVLFVSDKIPEPFCKCWSLRYGVTVNGKTYLLDLDGDKALVGKAAMLLGHEVQVAGTLQGDQVRVESLSELSRVPEFQLAVPLLK